MTEYYYGKFKSTAVGSIMVSGNLRLIQYLSGNSKFPNETRVNMDSTLSTADIIGDHFTLTLTYTGVFRNGKEVVLSSKGNFKNMIDQYLFSETNQRFKVTSLEQTSTGYRGNYVSEQPYDVGYLEVERVSSFPDSSKLPDSQSSNINIYCNIL